MKSRWWESVAEAADLLSSFVFLFPFFQFLLKNWDRLGGVSLFVFWRRRICLLGFTLLVGGEEERSVFNFGEMLSTHILSV